MNPFRRIRPLIATVLLCLATGCGTTLNRDATEQLLTSSAVDQSVANIDFSPLSGRRVYFDTTYIRSIKGVGFVNADYIISSLRQQMAAAGCKLEEKSENADYVVEGRVGALGTEAHEIIYGLPANNLLNAAASVSPSLPALPTIPEISLAKRNDQFGAAKLGVFAYHRESGQRVWQSGVSLATSRAKNLWVFGAGPFQQGAIYNGTQFAGSELGLPLHDREDDASHGSDGVAYDEAAYFGDPTEKPKDDDVQLAGHEEDGKKEDDASEEKAAP